MFQLLDGFEANILHKSLRINQVHKLKAQSKWDVFLMLNLKRYNTYILLESNGLDFNLVLKSK